MLDPRLDDQRADGVHYDDRVRILCCDSENQIVAIVPGRQVISVSRVAVYSDVSFARVRIDEDDRDVGLDGDIAGGIRRPVVEKPIDSRPVLARTSLNGFVGRYQI